MNGENVYLHKAIHRETAKKYINDPPERMTPVGILSMSVEDLLNLDYFLNDDELDISFGEEDFYIF